jgi:hypothetical protein
MTAGWAVVLLLALGARQLTFQVSKLSNKTPKYWMVFMVVHYYRSIPQYFPYP